jgi:hypothetical protein
MVKEGQFDLREKPEICKSMKLGSIVKDLPLPPTHTYGHYELTGVIDSNNPCPAPQSFRLKP